MKMLKVYFSFALLAFSVLKTSEASSQGFQHVVGEKISDFVNLGPDLTFTLNNRGGKVDPYSVNPEAYRTMGVYRVKGSSAFLRGANATDVFMNVGYARNVNVVWDTYDQKFGVLIENDTKLLNLEFSGVDSFQVNKDTFGKLGTPSMFVNASRLDGKKKFFVQRLTNGNKFGLYKSYRSEMVPASDNIAQTNLQQFELKNEYYYVDNSAPKGYKKLKPNANFLREEFKGNAKAQAFLANASFDDNKEAKLIAFIDALN
ncbi:hypothetical protein [Ferruginibacter sp. HRS2-29]|uniref:hypothetical protein n=1 Tax=Ferruginibacter sp. HRS2-29 TaxID=2487334 RepID=UPI0020CC461D|nr:hypothetical protein [Ferruginibacter sp. HRS2-29]MCP9753312.1 hypothetical protein [Ferruginibacter sp. HRS2-29]